jgi:hypothetical protein
MYRIRTAAAVAAGVVLLLAGCSSSTSKPAAVPTSYVAAGVATSATPADAPSTSGVAAPSTTEPSTTAAPPSTSAAPSTSSTCNLPDKGDILVWERFPGVQDNAQELGGTDPEHCTWTFDSLKTSQPTGAGYCTKAAWASDNPGYDPEAVPAPPLKNVQVIIGDCG